MIILFSTSRGFRYFCDNSHLFQKISEDYRRYPKMSKENRRFLRRNPKIFKEQIRIDKYAKRVRFFFQEKPSKDYTVFSLLNWPILQQTLKIMDKWHQTTFRPSCPTNLLQSCTNLRVIVWWIAVIVIIQNPSASIAFLMTTLKIIIIFIFFFIII